MVEVVEKPSFKPEDFDREGKRPGLSAIVRLKNEEDFAERALQSIAPYFDEIVIVYNGSTDRTPEIVERFAAAEPERVKAYHYVPEVFPPGSEMHRRLPPDHVSSLVHYYNFALAKATRQVCAKWDGDMIAAPAPLGAMVERIRRARTSPLRRWTSPWRGGFWWFSGVNLVDRYGGVYVLKTWPRVLGVYDAGFWPASRAHTFKHHPRFEFLDQGWLVRSFAGFAFFHVKAMKRDRGIGVYELEKNPASDYHKIAAEHWRDPEVMTFEEYLKIEPAARRLPRPEEMGIRPLTAR
jgi:glycosyltransferase involved in cell wall biosynthesis